MKVSQTALAGVKIIQPRVFADERGYFMETWKSSQYRRLGIDACFEQTNLSCSAHGVLRGLHYQWPQPQAKLVQVLVGRVFDVAVDIRPDSETYLQWLGVELSAENKQQLYIPEGFAHGFITLSETALLAYACSCEYAADADAAIAWDDPQINIKWPIPASEISAKDRAAPKISEVAVENLPRLKL